MTEDEIDQVQSLQYKTNWYIKKAWGDPAQQENAQRANEKSLEILTGGAYKSEFEDDRNDDEVPELPGEDLGKIQPAKNFTPPKWQVSGNDFPIVGRRFSKEEFLAYLQHIKKNESFRWSPKNVTIHHTAFPYLSMRPDGFTESHMRSLRSYYKGPKLGWRSGPQIFTDDHGIWVLTPITHRGVHARSFNSQYIGIEILGDFDYKDDPSSPRASKSIGNGVFAAAALIDMLGGKPEELTFHRDDPKTSKTCPGNKINKDQFISQVKKVEAVLP